eukprot:TRINITY_DN50208_c0_g1_i1.p1 TRINITY_DN50208_c0_g1~~TRINITY_DN50208_c0_g1_i1.p1  ORF type:complete len:282 (+),score=47.13 TRINITY_DN50208_c0_g1_i1:59-847(+)
MAVICLPMPVQPPCSVASCSWDMPPTCGAVANLLEEDTTSSEPSSHASWSPSPQPPTAFRRWTADGNVSLSRPEVVPGLRCALQDEGLSSYITAVEQWCVDMGAAYLNELVEEIDALADAVFRPPLLNQERLQRLRRALVAHSDPEAHHRGKVPIRGNAFLPRTSAVGRSALAVSCARGSGVFANSLPTQGGRSHDGSVGEPLGDCSANFDECGTSEDAVEEWEQWSDDEEEEDDEEDETDGIDGDVVGAASGQSQVHPRRW